MESNNMIEIRAAHKRYKSCPPLLKGLNMTVKKGHIYGLLGPSGCGKTTLLSCIVGRRMLDSGSIELGVFRKSDIGYMPQDTALFMDFKIIEIFHFYGTLFALPNTIIKKRADKLSKMLELPPEYRFIKTLSGGQQRRLSFAVALLHDPQLLIMDEPTVGVDPVLCHSMWEYLIHLASVETKTIIITTHYIEEAKQSNMIGLMREGVLLIEAPPMDLIRSQNSSSLEEAFLELSKKQHEAISGDDHKGGMMMNYTKVEPIKAKPPLPEGEMFNFSRFLAQLWKNIRWTQRNIPMLLFTLLLPAVQAYLFCESFGKDPKDLIVGLVSNELYSIQDSCNDLIHNVTYSPLLECDIPASFSCMFWKELTNKMDIKLYSNVMDARMAASKNEIWGVMQLHGNFSYAVEQRINEGIQSDDYTVEQSTVSAWMDMSNYIIAHIIKKNMLKCMIEFMKDVVEICGAHRKVGDIPLKMNDAIFGDKDSPVFAHSSAAAFICSFVFYFTMVFTSGAIKVETLAGLIERSMVSGMTRFEIVTAHLIVQFVMMTLQSIFMMVVMFIFYDNPLHGDLTLSISLLALVAFVGIAFGFFLAEVFEEEKLISYAGIGITMCLFLINGCLWPIEGAHDFIKTLNRLAPIVPAVVSFNTIATKGFGLENMNVVEGFVSCIAWITIFSSLTHYFATKKK